MKKEYILCAAIWVDNGNNYEGHHPKNIENGFVVCGLRHCNCFTTLSFIWNNDIERVAILRSAVQGFLTSDNRFVDRKEAYKIAFDNDQIIGPNKGYSENSIGLTSEDLY